MADQQLISYSSRATALYIPSCVQAKSAAPAVLFIDNIDTLAPARYDASGSGEKTSSTARPLP